MLQNSYDVITLYEDISIMYMYKVKIKHITYQINEVDQMY